MVGMYPGFVVPRGIPRDDSRTTGHLLPDGCREKRLEERNAISSPYVDIDGYYPRFGVGMLLDAVIVDSAGRVYV